MRAYRGDAIELNELLHPHDWLLADEHSERLQVLDRRLDVDHVDPMLGLLADVAGLLGLLELIRLKQLPLVAVGEEEDVVPRGLLVTLQRTRERTRIERAHVAVRRRGSGETAWRFLAVDVM